MKKLILILALLIAGCSTVPEQRLADISTPANLSKRCPDLPHMDSPATLGDSVRHITFLQQLYTDCAMRSDSQIEVATPKK